MTNLSAWAAIAFGLAAVIVAIPPLLKVPHGRVWAAVTGVLALVGAGLGVLSIVRAPGPPVEVTFTDPLPGSPKVKPAKNRIRVRGTVLNLPGDHTLWIVSQPIDGGDFFVVDGSPATRENGSWSVTDVDAGDPDDNGAGFVYYAVDATKNCDASLANVKAPTRRIGRKLPPGWSCRIVGPEALIRFTG